NDVSVYRNLLFVSGEDFNGRLDCGTQGVADSVSKDRMRGIRIFDISDITHPKPITAVQTCRGSHTHTLLTDPKDTANVYIYVSGGAPVRSPNELPGCSDLAPDKDPNSERFRIEVIQVPLAHPEQAHVVTKPAILADLTEPAVHGEAPEDIAAAAKAAAEARAKGGFTATFFGTEHVLRPRFVAAHRRGGGFELRVLALGDVQQRRHQGAVHRRVGRGAGAQVPRDRQARVGSRRDLHGGP